MNEENVWVNATTKIVDILIEIMETTGAENVGDIVNKIEELKDK